MTAPKWMPPLPQSHFGVCLAPYTTGIEAPTPMVDGYTADQMRRAQADAARAALEQAAKVCRARAVLWRMRVVPMLGIAAELDVAADAIEQMAKEIT